MAKKTAYDEMFKEDIVKVKKKTKKKEEIEQEIEEVDELKVEKERVSLYPTAEEYDKLLMAYQKEKRKRKKDGKKGRYTFSQFIIDSAIKGISS